MLGLGIILRHTYLESKWFVRFYEVLNFRVLWHNFISFPTANSLCTISVGQSHFPEDVQFIHSMFFFFFDLSFQTLETSFRKPPKFQQFSGGLNYADRNLKAIHKFAVVHYNIVRCWQRNAWLLTMARTNAQRVIPANGFPHARENRKKLK